MNERLRHLSLQELRLEWSKLWGRQPHGTMGRAMMVESIKFKQWERDAGGLSPDQKNRLSQIIKAYKRNPKHFDKAINLKPGTRLVRTWKGKKYCVTATRDGFDYNGTPYNSLSKIANDITGTRWNGWVFFGLRK